MSTKFWINNDTGEIVERSFDFEASLSPLDLSGPFDSYEEAEAARTPSIKEETPASTPDDARISTDEMEQVAADEFEQPEYPPLTEEEEAEYSAAMDELRELILENETPEKPDPMAEESAAEDGVTPGSETLTIEGDSVASVAPEAPKTVEQLIIQIGGTKIVAEASLNNASAEQIKQAIADLYPEVKHATVSEATEDGKRKVQFASQPGRKG